jgi:hypothetical protein
MCCFKKTLSHETYTTAQHAPKELSLAADVPEQHSQKATLNGMMSSVWFVTVHYQLGPLIQVQAWSLENTAANATFCACIS